MRVSDTPVRSQGDHRPSTVGAVKGDRVETGSDVFATLTWGLRRYVALVLALMLALGVLVPFLLSGRTDEYQATAQVGPTQKLELSNANPLPRIAESVFNNGAVEIAVRRELNQPKRERHPVEGAADRGPGQSRPGGRGPCIHGCPGDGHRQHGGRGLRDRARRLPELGRALRAHTQGRRRQEGSQDRGWLRLGGSRARRRTARRRGTGRTGAGDPSSGRGDPPPRRTSPVHP